MDEKPEDLVAGLRAAIIERDEVLRLYMVEHTRASQIWIHGKQVCWCPLCLKAREFLGV